MTREWIVMLLIDWYGIIFDIGWHWPQRTRNYNVWR